MSAVRSRRRFSARSRARAARSRSIPSARSAISARTLTRSGRTSAKPQAIATKRLAPPRLYVSSPIPRVVSNGVCPGRTPSDPSVPGRTTASTTSLTTRLSGVTTSRWIDSGRGIGVFLGGRLHLFGLVAHLVDRSDQIERLLRQIVVFPLEDFLEGAHALGDRHVFPLQPGELLRDEERLRQEL